MAILAKTFQGLNGGMNQAVPQHEIPDGQASYMQDIIVNVPGIIKRRGPLSKISGSSTVPFRSIGIASTMNSAGATRIMLLSGDAGTANLYFYSADLTSKIGPYTAGGGLTKFRPTPRNIVDAKPALNAGTIVGVSTGYTPDVGNGQTGLMYWRGAGIAADISTASCTTTLGGATVTTITAGGFSTVTAGMFAFHSNIYVGTVKSVETGTSLTLEYGAPDGFAGGTIVFRPIRPILPKVMKGRISIAPGSTIVNGTQGPEGTKFVSQGITAPPYSADDWRLYRLSDGAYIGNVSTVTDNATMTVGVNNLPAASSGMTDERYFAQRMTVTNPVNYSVTSSQWVQQTVGFLNCVWNGRQWYANVPLSVNGTDLTARLWFSDPADPEGLDLSSADGDFIDVSSTTGSQTPIVALQGIPAGLLVFKETELFMVTGSDYTNFTVRKIADTGTLATGSVQAVGNGAIWAGREGIFFFDGQNIRNLSNVLGDYWTQSIKAFSTATDRMGSYVWKNQYVLHIENFSSTYTIRKSAATTTPTNVTFCIELDTFAITTFSNVGIKDSTPMPSSSGFPTLAIVDDGGSPGVTSIVDTSILHSATGTGPDTITCGGLTIGPDFYLETKKYDLGDPERKKLFKQLAMNYLLTGNTLAMDTVPGLNSTGTPINTTWATQSSWANLRKKFTKRDTHLQFRFYQSSSAVTDVRIGPHALGFKVQRVGRV